MENSYLAASGFSRALSCESQGFFCLVSACDSDSKPFQLFELMQEAEIIKNLENGRMFYL